MVLPLHAYAWQHLGLVLVPQVCWPSCESYACLRRCLLQVPLQVVAAHVHTSRLFGWEPSFGSVQLGTQFSQLGTWGAVEAPASVLAACSSRPMQIIVHCAPTAMRRTKKRCTKGRHTACSFFLTLFLAPAMHLRCDSHL